MKKRQLLSALLTTLLFTASSVWGATVQELKNPTNYIAVPKILNFDSYIKKGSIKVKKLSNGDKEIEFIHYEDQGNAVCAYDSKFIYNDTKGELRLKRSSMKRFGADGKLQTNLKMGGDFNIGKDSSGYTVYTGIITGEIGGSGKQQGGEPQAAAARKHNIIADNTVKNRWAITEGISYNDVRKAAYNTTYMPISTPLYATAEYEKNASKAGKQMETARSYIIRGSAKPQRLANGDTKIYYQWVQVDEDLPVLLINSCFYFEEKSQKLFRYDTDIFKLDNATGKQIGHINNGETAPKECPRTSTSFDDFQNMKAGKFNQKK